MHFTLTVIVSAKQLAAHDGQIRAAVEEMMAPYNEQTEDEKHLTFQDDEDEYRARYKSESVERIFAPDGANFWPWDERFRADSDDVFSNKRAGYEQRTLPFKDIYATFEDFVKDYTGTGIDPKTGRYGHWRNPNGQWDWFSIGGRWTGFYPVKEGRQILLGEPGTFGNQPKPSGSDIVLADDIDMDAVAHEANKQAESFWTEWQRFLFDVTHQAPSAFEGPRSQALDIGLLRVEQGPVHCLRHADCLSNREMAAACYAKSPPVDEKVVPWEEAFRNLQPGDQRAAWNDVAKLVDYAKFQETYLPAFSSIATYAVLNEDGWHASGKRGNDDPDAYREFKRDFVKKFIHSAAKDDTIVLIDYHT